MNHTTPVPATRLENNGQLFEEEKPAPGSFAIYHNAVWYMCPCGCGDTAHLPIRGMWTHKGPTWEWDGNEEKPTLSPSIRRIGSCKFHGHLVKGVWTFCNDSGK